MTDPKAQNQTNQPHKLTLTAVGLGPGDPNLITMKGILAMQAAQLIFVPRSKDGEQSLALRIAESWLEPDRQEIVELPLPMTRNADQLNKAWQNAADQIKASLAQYNPTEPVRGVYLLLGDPLLYGTFTYIWAELRERYPKVEIDIIPGVTSFAASAARAQFVLSSTSDRVAILPASYETDEAQLRRLLSDFDTVVLMKVGPVFPQILAALDSMGLVETTLYAERVGMPEELVVLGQALFNLPNQKRPYLSLMIVRQKAQ